MGGLGDKDCTRLGEIALDWARFWLGCTRSGEIWEDVVRCNARLGEIERYLVRLHKIMVRNREILCEILRDCTR